MYPGRLLLLGVLGASVVRVGPMHTGATPPAPTEHHAVRTPHVVRAAGPPLPAGRAVHAGPYHTGAVPFSVLVVHPRVWRPIDEYLPGGRFLRWGLADVVRQVVQPARVVRGDPPFRPPARVARWGFQHTGETGVAPTDHYAVKRTRIVRGDQPLAAAVVRRWGESHTGLEPSAVRVVRIVRGEEPGGPARALRWGLAHTGATPASPTEHHAVRTLRVVRPIAMPLPEARVIRPPFRRAAPVVAHVAVVHPTVVRATAPLPGGRVVRSVATWHSGSVAVAHDYITLANFAMTVPGLTDVVLTTPALGSLSLMVPTLGSVALYPN